MPTAIPRCRCAEAPCCVVQTRIAVVGQGTGDVLCGRTRPALNIEYTPEVVSHTTYIHSSAPSQPSCTCLRHASFHLWSHNVVQAFP